MAKFGEKKAVVAGTGSSISTGDFGNVQFGREITGRETPCIGIYGAQGTGKTRLCVTASEWAEERGTVPGWLICDRKTRNTMREVCKELKVTPPLHNQEDFVDRRHALTLATSDDIPFVMKAYSAAYQRFLNGAIALADNHQVNPIIVDSGSQLWDWIAFAHFGRKQDVGRARQWGPPKQDWSDLFDALSDKLVLITLKSKDEWKNDNRTGRETWDGPPHLGFTTTTVVRLNIDSKRKLRAEEDENGPAETFVDRFTLDVVESQDRKDLEGQDGVLAGSAITLSTLMAFLRPND